jgi:hypothetical protein
MKVGNVHNRKRVRKPRFQATSERNLEHHLVGADLTNGPSRSLGAITKGKEQCPKLPLEPTLSCCRDRRRVNALGLLQKRLHNGIHASHALIIRQCCKKGLVRAGDRIGGKKRPRPRNKWGGAQTLWHSRDNLFRTAVVRCCSFRCCVTLN